MNQVLGKALVAGLLLTVGTACFAVDHGRIEAKMTRVWLISMEQLPVVKQGVG